MKRILLLLCAAITVSCAPAATREVGRASATQNSIITREEMSTRYWANAADVVSALRPNWLNDRGQETVNGTPMELQVHYNGSHIGAVGVLREITVSELQFLEFIDPVSATARWGLGYGKGAIVLSTKPR